MSKATDLADAVVELLNDETNDFSQTFEAARGAAVITDPQKLQTLLVTVFAGTKSSTRIARGKFEHVYKPVIAIQKKVGLDAEVLKNGTDELMLLVEQIESVIEDGERMQAVEDSEELSFQGFDEASQDEELYNPLTLREQGVFAKAIVLQFQD